MEDKIYSEYCAILAEELQPAMGCTEPIAVAYCAALARKTLGCLPEDVQVYASANIIKNVKSVVVPNTGGQRGLTVAAAAGIVAGDADAKLQVLAGITPEQVRGKPDFPALWQLLEPMLAGCILVAHNAPFDLRVLASCLHDYHIDWKPEAAYLCTCQMGRKAYPYLPNHKLNTLCDHLRLDLDHHNAGSDSRACALLLLDYLQKGLRPEPFLRTYRFADRKTLPYCTV